MTKKRSTKRALLLSALSLLMCVSMLIGSTFAWFTDSVTSAGNKIVSGSLKVDLEMYNKETKTWKSIKEHNDPIFTYEYWEPGYVDAKLLKVENEGNLALKWKAAFVSDVQLGILADVIDVFVKPGATEAEFESLSREDLATWTNAGTVREFLGGIEASTYGTLTPKGTAGATANLGIALKMRETAGNEYQEQTIGFFDIKILATQYTYEKDSFDDQYDANLNPIEDDEVMVEENGIQYVYTPEGENYLYLVTEDYTADTVVIPEGVTNIGNYAFAYNNNVKTVVLPSTIKSLGRGFDSSNVEKVVLNEGLEKIDSRAFKATPNLQEVVISSTVTEIADNAFQKSGLKSIIIPANVETIGETAFGSSLIETVTFEGNTAIQGYAFRGCAALRTVYLKGDDVTFVPSTLNGRNSCWFCNGESNNPNTSNITFYVENATVAERVKVAMGAEANNTPVYINEKIYVPVKNLAEFQKALDNAVNNTTICLTADINGDVTFTQKNDVTLVLDGNGKKMDGTVNIIARADTTNAATLTIKNFNFETTTDRSFIHSVETNRYPNNVTIANCTFKGTGANGDVVAVTVKSANNLVIKDCKADNVHSLLQNTSGWNLTVKKCEITNSGRGMSLGTVQGARIENVKIDASAEKYGIRMDAGYNNNAVITDCNVKAFIPVVVRKASVNSNVTFNGANTMTALNTDGIWCAIGTSEYEANGVMPTAATASVTVTLNDAGLNASGIYGATAIN